MTMHRANLLEARRGTLIPGPPCAGRRLQWWDTQIERQSPVSAPKKSLTPRRIAYNQRRFPGVIGSEDLFQDPTCFGELTLAIINGDVGRIKF